MLRRLLLAVRESGLFYLLGTLFAAAVKWFYSRAGAEDLGFILAPTCWLVGLLTGLDFEHERGAGYTCHAARLIVGPSCAGLNFLVIAFVTMFHSFVHRLHGAWSKLMWLLGSAGSAYLLALGTNALRIVAGIELGPAAGRGAFIAPAQSHRLLGTLVYCVTLWVVHRSLRHFLARRAPRTDAAPAPVTRRKTILAGLVPFGWYALIALGIPLLNGASRQEGFFRHALVVLVVLLALSAATLLERKART